MAHLHVCLFIFSFKFYKDFKMFPIIVSLTMRGVNKTTFAADKAVLQTIIAVITNTSSAQSSVIEYLSSITKEGAFMPYRSIICQLLPLTRSSELRNDEVAAPSASCALVLVAVIPMDVAHEEYALSKINDKTAFRTEINGRLIKQITEGNPSVIHVGSVVRIPGEMIHS